jgi:hypothetical protein
MWDFLLPYLACLPSELQIFAFSFYKNFDAYGNLIMQELSQRPLEFRHRYEHPRPFSWVISDLHSQLLWGTLYLPFTSIGPTLLDLVLPILSGLPMQVQLLYFTTFIDIPVFSEILINEFMQRPPEFQPRYGHPRLSNTLIRERLVQVSWENRWCPYSRTGQSTIIWEFDPTNPKNVRALDKADNQLIKQIKRRRYLTDNYRFNFSDVRVKFEQELPGPVRQNLRERDNN